MEAGETEVAMQSFIIEYEFTSTRADGDNYTLRATVQAKDKLRAIHLARAEGWDRFGARFTDNCVDWRVVAG
jgi:hypothetical protein